MKSICELLSIKYPIIQGSMGNISQAALTAAVSEAGGLGTVGTGTMTPREVEAILLETKRKTSSPFAVHIDFRVNPYVHDLIDLVLKYRVPVVSLPEGDHAQTLSLLHHYGIIVIAAVSSVKQAQKAEAAGADLLVAEGFEAAGMNSSHEMTTFTLIPQIISAVSIPVVAAGGIGDGKGLAAAFMLGAKGVQMGTRLIATKESRVPNAYKEKLIQASGLDTQVIGRSVGRVKRVIKTGYAEKIVHAEKAGIGLEEFNQMTTEDKHMKGAVWGDVDNGLINCGQVAGLITSIPNVKELFANMMEEAVVQMNEVSHRMPLVGSKLIAR